MASAALGCSRPQEAANKAVISQPKIQEQLSGEDAFYNQFTYLATTKRGLTSTDCLPTTYKCNIEDKAARVAWLIFSLLFLPLGIYQFLHWMAGKIIVPASISDVFPIDPNIQRKRIQLNDSNPWKYKRITVEVDGYKIDGIIMGQASTLANGRWMLYSGGNAECYEYTASYSTDLKNMLSKINSNAILFNYPGVGASSGHPNRKIMEKAYRAMLTFLEDKEHGIGAKEIIGYGHSIGGGVQGDALRVHPLNKDVKYVFVKSRTFSNLQKTASSLTCGFLGLLVQLLGWNISSIKSSKTLKAPEIILQTAKVKKCTKLTDSSKIIDDDIISAKSSLAKALLDDRSCSKEHKLFVGIPERHNDGLRDESIEYLAARINESFQSQET